MWRIGSNTPYGFLPSAVGTNKIGDYYQNSGALVARLGAWPLGSNTGVGCWNLADSSGYRSRHFGARLMYIPQ